MVIFCTSYQIDIEMHHMLAFLGPWIQIPRQFPTFPPDPEIYNKNKLCRLKDEVRTPYSILKKVVIGIITRTVKIPDINRLLHRRKKRMENPDLPRWHDVPIDEETENLLSSIILLEEFCKELAAITVVKFETAEKILKQQQQKIAASKPQNPNFKQGRSTRNSAPAEALSGQIGFGGGTILVAAEEEGGEDEDEEIEEYEDDDEVEIYSTSNY